MTRNAELSSGRPGPRAFDLLHGTWRVTNRRIVDRADPACDFWETFGARSTVEPILGGWGHTDRFVAARTTAGTQLQGLALRLFEPSSRTWRIRRSDTARQRLVATAGSRYPD